MTIRSITQKVVQAEKRKLDDQRTSPFSTFAVFVFWIIAATGALSLAVASYYTADWETRRADALLTGIDTITTAGISGSGSPRNFDDRTKLIRQSAQQNRRLDDVARVIHRLRGEQTALNTRLAELDSELRKMRERTEFLENKLSEKTSTNTKNINKPLLPNVKRGTLENDAGLTPRNVKVRRVSSHAPPPASLETDHNPQDSGLSEGTSTFAKSRKTGAPEIDRTKVGSIKRAQSSRFAIDLGLNPTQKRANALWESLKTTKPDVLNQLTPRFVETGNGAGETRLVAGPYVDAGDAIKACVALRSAKAFCKTTLFPN